MVAITFKKTSFRTVMIIQTMLILLCLAILLAHVVIFLIPYDEDLQKAFKPLTIANGGAITFAVGILLYMAIISLRNKKNGLEDEIFQTQNTMFSTLIFTVTVMGISLSIQYMYRNFKEAKLDEEDISASAETDAKSTPKRKRVTFDHPSFP